MNAPTLPASVLPGGRTPLVVRYGGQVKWRGRPCRFYYRGERPDGHLQELLEAMEADREAALVETDFKD